MEAKRDYMCSECEEEGHNRITCGRDSKYRKTDYKRKREEREESRKSFVLTSIKNLNKETKTEQ